MCLDQLATARMQCLGVRCIHNLRDGLLQEGEQETYVFIDETFSGRLSGGRPLINYPQLANIQLTSPTNWPVS